MIRSPIPLPVDTTRWRCLLLLFVLTGCVAYAPRSADSGYSELDFSSDVFEARFEWKVFKVDWASTGLTVTQKFALLRGAELAHERGASVFCVESIYEYSASVRWDFFYDYYAAYTIRAFEEAPPDREIATLDSVPPDLYACYETSETERWLRARQSIWFPDPPRRR